MFDYLQQFNRLPKDLRDKVSSPLVMAAISELEKKYKADLAAIVMKVMIKGVPIKELALYLASESGLSPEKSEELAGEMRTKVFSSAADYLGLTTLQRALDLNKDIEVIIKEAGLVLPSSVLVNRFKTILSTFLKGVRSKIDTRNSLMKDTKIGGLKLSSDEVDRIFKICASYKFSNLITDLPDHHKDADDRSQQKVAEPPVKEVEAQKQQPDTSSAPSAMQKISPRLAEIIAQADQEGG